MGVLFVSSSFWLLGVFFLVLMLVRMKCNELKEIFVVGIIIMEKYWINRLKIKSIVILKEIVKSVILFLGFWVFIKCIEN